MREFVLSGEVFVSDSYFTSDESSLRIQLWSSSSATYEINRSLKDKPRALACTAIEYLAQLHETFHNATDDDNAPLSVRGTLSPTQSLDITVHETSDDIRFDSWTMMMPTCVPLLPNLRRWVAQSRDAVRMQTCCVSCAHQRIYIMCVSHCT